LSEGRRVFSNKSLDYFKYLSRLELSPDYLYKDWYCDGDSEKKIDKGVIKPVRFDVRNDVVEYLPVELSTNDGRLKYSNPNVKNNDNKEEYKKSISENSKKMSIDDFIKLCVDNPKNEELVSNFKLDLDDVRKTELNQDKNLFNWIKSGWDDVDFEYNSNFIGKLGKNDKISHNGIIIGKKGELKKLVSDNEKDIIGYLNNDGFVYGINDTQIGYIDKLGKVFKSPEGETAKQIIFDTAGDVLGYITSEDKIKEIKNKGKRLGKIAHSAYLARDKDGDIIGYITDENEVLKFKDLHSIENPRVITDKDEYIINWYNSLSPQQKDEFLTLYKLTHGNLKRASEFVNIKKDNRKNQSDANGKKKKKKDPRIANDGIPGMPTTKKVKESNYLTEEKYNLDGANKNIVNAIFKVIDLDVKWMMLPILMKNKKFVSRDMGYSSFHLTSVKTKEKVKLNNNNELVFVRTNQLVKDDLEKFKQGLVFTLTNLKRGKYTLELTVDEFDKLLDHQGQFSTDVVDQEVISNRKKLSTKVKSSWTYQLITKDKVKELLLAFMHLNERGCKYESENEETIQMVENDESLYNYTSDKEKIKRRIDRVKKEKRLNDKEAKNYVEAHNQFNFLYLYKKSLETREINPFVTSALRIFCNDNGSKLYSIVPIRDINGSYNYYITKLRDGADVEDVGQDYSKPITRDIRKGANQ
jgi:hypothetical protein